MLTLETGTNKQQSRDITHLNEMNLKGLFIQQALSSTKPLQTSEQMLVRHAHKDKLTKTNSELNVEIYM